MRATWPDLRINLYLMIVIAYVLLCVVIVRAYGLQEGDRGGTAVKALCYKSEGRCFDPRWCQWNFSLT